jgi:hypothetical protein
MEVVDMARASLWQETAQTIRAYVDGTLSPQAATAWATGIIAHETFLSDELLLEHAILTLLELQEPDAAWATAKQDLEQLLECLQGTRHLQVELQYSPQPLKVKE